MGRHRKNPAQDDWKKKVHAVFFELAELIQEFEKRWVQLQEAWMLGPNAADPTGTPSLQDEIAGRTVRDTSQLDQWLSERLVDINSRYTVMPYNPLVFSYLTLDPPISDAEGIREYLHFHRHGESLRVTGAKDSGGDLDAWDKIARTERDVRILAYGKGPIKPFQGDLMHRQLLQLVICFESEPLTAEDLAQCFDKYCACGKESHDADALRKMRNRVEAELRAH